MGAIQASTARARRLRRAASPPEKRLWEVLRKRRTAGARFVRQKPMGPFVLDFYCAASRLAVEVDGHQHAKTMSRDDRRDRWLRESRGIRVLRFSTADVMGRLELVRGVIADAVLQAG